MNKLKLMELLSNINKMSKTESKTCIDVIITEIINSIKSANGVEIRGFGSFKKKQKKARIGINPKTGVRTSVEAKFMPFFKPGKELKNAVNNK